MNLILTVFEKEFKAYFSSPVAYIYIISFLIFMSWYFFRGFFVIGQATMRPFLDLLPWVFLFLIPAISMRVWSEEKKAGTLDFMFTFPIQEYELVIGKFLASLLLMILTILGSFPLVLVVMFLGNPDMGPIITGYVGAILLGSAFLSIGFLMSSLTKNQIVAFILSVIACFFAFVLSQSIVLSSVPEFLAPLFRGISLGAHFESITRGILDLRDVFFYVCFIGLFLYLNVQILESRKIG